MRVLCAFSSDSRNLYKADIYRVLALPEGYVVHFRYKHKYVSDELLTSSVSLEGKSVAIFFTRTESSGLKSGLCENISVRWASVFSVARSAETDVFHVYMKLGKFCNISVEDKTVDVQPPSKFFGYLECKENSGLDSWHGRVSALKDYFPQMIYFHLKGVEGAWGSVNLSYHDKSKSCYYRLVYGERYILRLALANPDGFDAKIEFSDSADDIVINCINPLATSVQFDDFEIPIFAKSLQVSKQASFFEFKPLKEGEKLWEYATNIELELGLSRWRPVIFGFFSVLAAAAILMVTPMSSTSDRPGMLMYLFSALMLGAASGSMFYWFNKK